MKRKAFTILELVMVVIVLSILASLALGYYRYFAEKAKAAEAYAGIGAIKHAEEIYKMESGTYVNAADSGDINAKLFVGIAPKYYEYKVVGATEDNFLVVAKRIGEDLSNYIASGAMPAEFMLLAMDKSGPVSSASLFDAAGSGGGTATGGGGSWGSIGNITGWTGAISGGGASGGVTGGSGAGGGIPGYKPGGTVTDTGISMTPIVYSADIQNALNKISSLGTVFQYFSQSGVTLAGDTATYYSDLITEKNINVTYLEMDSNTLGYFSSSDNLIAINQSLQNDPGWPTESISAIITHEATHADYFYNTAKWYNRITTLWPEADGPYYVDPTKLIDPVSGGLYYSITEEYFTNANEAQLWREYQANYAGVPGDGINFENDKVTRYEQGEAVVRAYLVSIPAYHDLPEFYPGN